MSQLLNPLWIIHKKDVKRVEGPDTRFVEPTFNYPEKLRESWNIEPITGNSYKCTKKTPITLTGGTDNTDLDFYFHHRVTRWVLLQETSAGVRSSLSLTWSFERLIGTVYLVEFSKTKDKSHSIIVPVDDMNLETAGERYRLSFTGTATNKVEVQVWIEVLR